MDFELLSVMLTTTLWAFLALLFVSVITAVVGFWLCWRWWRILIHRGEHLPFLKLHKRN